MTVAEALALANEQMRNGRLPEAEALCRDILAQMPGQPDVLHLLGAISYFTGRMEDALGHFRDALATNPQLAGTRNNLACTLVELGRYEEAIREFEIALRSTPLDAEMNANLGNALYHTGRLGEAEAACRTALSIQPSLASAHNNLGNALRGLRRYDEALESYRAALRFEPRYAEAQSNLGAILSDRFDNEGAVAALRIALEWNPNLVSAHSNLACALSHLGRGWEAIESHQRAIALGPGDPLLHSNFIYNLQFIAGLDPGLVSAEQTAWNERHARPFATAIAPHTNPRETGRMLRVGYVSPDFREHPIAFFLSGLFSAQDRTQIETHCYSSVQQPDAVTAQLRRSADCWHDVLSLSHAALAEKIRADRIDILVDLSMHSAENRLPVFARKPAPVQVSWLAYPGTTGLETIDYRFTDATLEPTGDAMPHGPERPIHLPDAWCCYEPIGPFPEITALPATGRGHVTFGSFSKTSRLSDAVLRCWSAIAAQMPHARWLLLHPEGAGRERVRSFFGENAHRVEFVRHLAWVDYLQHFARIDLCLDTFPCTGLTATCHALWMGAPVVTLAGTMPVARAGASILSAAGLPELIADSEDDYVNRAVALASDHARLAELRATLRERLRRSALMDAPRFARNLEAAYRGIWREWCATHGSRKSAD